MANGRRFNPDRLTAASWFYPLGTKVRVTLSEGSRAIRSVVVTITDRGPAKDLVRDGRIIDLTHAAFRRLAHPDRGLVAINVEVVPKKSTQPSPMPQAVAAVPAKPAPVEVCQAAPQALTPAP
jgi:rare lipoprotein A